MLSTAEVEICPISGMDIEDISKIEKTCFADPYPRQFLEQLALTNPSTSLVARVDVVLVGYVVIDRWKDHNHLVSIAVLPDYRRRGVGRRLLMSALKLARDGRPFRLEVRKSNLPAIQFYLGFGFQQTRIRERYYSDGEDAILMEGKF